MKTLRFLSVLLIACMSMTTMTVEAKKKPKTPQQTLQDQLTPVMPQGRQRMYIFCKEESYDKPGEYMAALGISSESEEEAEALHDAYEQAQENLCAKFAGVITNAVSNYNKSTKVPSGKKISEKQRENIATNVVQKAIDKYGNDVCHEIVSTPTGGFIAYVALQFMESVMDRAMTEGMEELGVDFDRQNFLKSMQEQLDQFNEKQKKAQAEYAE